MRGFVFFLAFVSSLGFQGALGAEFKDLNAWSNEVSSLRQAVISETTNTPYTERQHSAFRSYFSRIAIAASELAQDEKERKRFSKSFEKLGAERFCSQVLISKVDSEKIIEGCTRNNFFLCSDEVRAYGQIAFAFRDSLSESLKTSFDQIQSCVEAISR